MLTDKNLALLNTKLQAPMIVTDIMDGQCKMSDDIQYGLHELISEFEPDTALLAIAASAQRIAKTYTKASDGMSVLAIECQRLLDEYGDLWLKNAEGNTPSEQDVFDILSHTAEDLEGLVELLELNNCFLRAKDPQASALFTILSIQARAHSLIAEEFIRAADEAAEAIAETAATLPIAAANAPTNIIRFPVETVRA